MSSNLVPWMIISWIHDGYYGNMVDEYHIIYWAWVTCLISWTHDTVTSCVVTKTYHVSCVVTKAGLTWAVCVCATQLTAHVSVSSTLQGHKCHMITFLGPGKSYKCEKSWVSGRPAVGIPVYLHFWAWAETQVSVYRDWAKLPRSYLSISLYKVYQDKISTNSETMSSLK